MDKLKLLLFFLCISCSLKSIVIPNITYLVSDHIGGKYDFYYSQEKVFKKSLDQLIRDKKEPLNTLADHLKSIDIKEYDLKADLKNFASLYFSFASEINKILAKPISEFNPGQQKEFFKVLENDNETILNRSRRDRTDEIAKRFEFFFDKLSSKQYELIKKNIAIFQSINKTRLSNRLVTQAGIKNSFKIKDLKMREVEIVKIFDTNLKSREPLSNLKGVAVFCTKFFKTLNSKQVRFFKQKQQLIVEWIQALTKYYQ